MCASLAAHGLRQLIDIVPLYRDPLFWIAFTGWSAAALFAALWLGSLVG